MKSLLMLLLGAVCGAVATVVLFTVDPSFEGTDADGAGGGNVTMILTEEALGTLIANELPKLPAFGEEPQVSVTVGSNGILVVDIAIGGLGVGLRGSVSLNPEIVNSRLHLEVVDARLGELAVPDELAEALEVPFRERLESLAGGFEYRVTAIRTTDARLTIEIQI
jgi:hypothetical protein